MPRTNGVSHLTQKGHEYTNKSYAVATVEKDLPKAFSIVLHDTLERAKHREFDPKRQQWCRRVAHRKARDGNNIRALVKGRAKVNLARGPNKGKPREEDIGAVTNPIGRNPRMINGIGVIVISSTKEATREGQPARDTGGHHPRAMAAITPKGALRPREEAVEWHGAMYTKYTYSDGRVQWDGLWRLLIAMYCHI